jgi:hypothetical protein
MLLTSFQIILSIFAYISKTEKMGSSKYLRKMNIFFIMSSAELDETAVYIKILLNFLQIATAA